MTDINMTITERLHRLDNLQYDKEENLTIHNEGEWSRTVSKYSAFNDAGVECEVGEFLYAMVRILKPSRVLETGTHKGIGASYLGLALKDNEMGMLETIEFLPELHRVSENRIQRLDLEKYVDCVFQSSLNYIPESHPSNNFSHLYGLIFLDTEPQIRFQELVRYYDYLEPGGYVFIHDLHPHMNQVMHDEHGFAWPFGKVPPTLEVWVKHHQLIPFHFRTPRGLTGFYKPAEDDYVGWYK